MAKVMKIRTAAALVALSCAPAAAAQGDPDGPVSEPPAAANPMGGSAQPGNLGEQGPSGGPRVSSNAEVERAGPVGPPDFPENNDLPEHGGPDLPPRPPAAQQQQQGQAVPNQEPAPGQQPQPEKQEPGQPEPGRQVSQPVPQPQQQARPVPDQGSARQPVSQPAQSQPAQAWPARQPGLLPGAVDVGSLVSQVLGFLPRVG